MCVCVCVIVCVYVYRFIYPVACGMKRDEQTQICRVNSELTNPDKANLD